MGTRDSSRTRVAPVFDYLRERDPTGRDWLAPLLRLPERDGTHVLVADPGELVDWAWHPAEKTLPAPLSLLRYLVENPEALSPEGLVTSTGEAREKRQQLLEHNLASRAEALAALETYAGGKAWYAFEGAHVGRRLSRDQPARNRDRRQANGAGTDNQDDVDAG